MTDDTGMSAADRKLLDEGIARLERLGAGVLGQVTRLLVHEHRVPPEKHAELIHTLCGLADLIENRTPEEHAECLRLQASLDPAPSTLPLPLAGPVAAAIRARANVEAIEKARKSAPLEPGKVYQLTLWPEHIRGMPNPMVRSALFSAVHSKERRFINRELIAAVDGAEIRFLGEQLNQEDFEVCTQVYHLAREHPLGTMCHTTARAFLKSLGRSGGGDQQEDLHASLVRLAQPVEIETDRIQYFGGLIMEGVKETATKQYVLRVNPRLGPLFEQGWTRLEVEQRHALRGKHLALWLHAFYASHDKPHEYKVELLHRLCGSRTEELWKFRQLLKRALGALREVGAIIGGVIDDDDHVVIKRKKVQLPHRA